MTFVEPVTGLGDCRRAVKCRVLSDSRGDRRGCDLDWTCRSRKSRYALEARSRLRSEAGCSRRIRRPRTSLPPSGQLKSNASATYEPGFTSKTKRYTGPEQNGLHATHCPSGNSSRPISRPSPFKLVDVSDETHASCFDRPVVATHDLDRECAPRDCQGANLPWTESVFCGFCRGPREGARSLARRGQVGLAPPSFRPGAQGGRTTGDRALSR